MFDYSVLIVDDESTVRRMLAHRLGQRYDVQVASTGQEALSLVERKVPDLIVSDIMMPGMDGFKLQEALQLRGDAGLVPFIFLTARSDFSSRQQGLRTGVDDYLTKPVDMELLISRIQRLLDRSAHFRKQLHSRISDDFSSRLVREQLPAIEGYRFMLHSRPLVDGGGDMFDWVKAEPGAYYLTVGDVMGKGLQAKFYAFSFWACVRSALRTVIRNNRSPATILSHVNSVLVEDPPMEDTFASILLMKWEPEINRVTYANAGHCRPIVVHGGVARIAAYSDMILGLDASARYRDTTLSLLPGAAIVSYTDGLTEHRRPSGEPVGEDGALKLAAEVYGLDEPARAIAELADEKAGGDGFEDDILISWLQRDVGYSTNGRAKRRPAPGSIHEIP